MDVLQNAYAAGVANIIIRNLEGSIRSFLRSGDDFERSDAHPDIRREDHFANFEVEALKLVMNIKKVHGEKEKIQSVSNSQKEDTEKVAEGVEAKKCRKRVSVTFVNPRKNLKKSKFSCPHCAKIYESIKSLQNHVRQDHKQLKKVSVNDFKEEEPIIQCLLLKKNGNPCTYKSPINQMGRHISSTSIHNKSHSRPSPETKFRGWRFYPNETKVVWLRVTDPDPPSSEEMEIDDSDQEDSAELPTNDNDNAPSEGTTANGDKTGEIKGTEEKKIEENGNSNVEFVDVNNPVQFQESAEVTNNSTKDGENVVEKVGLSTDNTSASQSSSYPLQRRRVHFNPEVILINDNSDIINSIVTLNSNDLSDFEFIADAEEISRIINSGNGPRDETYKQDQHIGKPSDVLLSSGAAQNETLIYSAGMEAIAQLQDNEETIEGKACENIDNKLSVFIDEEGGSILNDSNMDLFVSQEVEVSTENKDNTSQESVTREPLTQPSSLHDVRDLVSNFITVSVVNPEMKKGTIWTDPNFDTFTQEQNQANDQRKIITTDDLQQDVEPEVLFKEVNCDEAASDSESNISIDSDYDENFDVDIETTRNRQERKKVRHYNRDNADHLELAEQPENAMFIEQFLDWLKSITKMSTTNENCSTINFSVGHGWDYYDSFLNFQCSEDPTFNLNRLIDFRNKENFLFISSPVSWILKASQGNPTRCSEQLKLHKRLRNFIAFKALQAKFNANDVTWKMAITQHLASIDTEVSNNKFFQKFSKQYKVDLAKSKKMKQILKPDAEQLEYQSVKLWFRSDECKSLMSEVDVIYDEAMKTNQIKPSKFNRCAMIIRFTIAIKDKNRPSIYDFTNMDYLCKVKAWLPDLDTYIWSIDDLPDGWKLYSPPSPGVPPTCFEIRLDGSNPLTKGNKETNVIIDRHSYKLLEKYQKLKKLVFREPSTSAAFFVNHRGKKLSRLQRYPGSLVELFGRVIGKPDFNMTNIRKALEGKLQNSNQSSNTLDINNHSSQVVDVYDNVSASRRNLAISSVGQAEGSTVSDEDFKKVYDERTASEAESLNQLKIDAKKYLEERKKGKSIVDLTPSSLTEDDITFLRNVFTTDDLEGKIFCILCSFCYSSNI